MLSVAGPLEHPLCLPLLQRAATLLVGVVITGCVRVMEGTARVEEREGIQEMAVMAVHPLLLEQAVQAVAVINLFVVRHLLP